MPDRTTRLAVLDAHTREVEIMERGIPPPAAGGAVLRIEMAGVCGTDVHFWNGTAPFPHSMVLGHEGVGILEELGAGAVTDHAGVPVAEGDRVVWAPQRACHRCHACTVQGDETACDTLEIYCRPDEPNWAAFADYAWLPPDIHFYRIPDDTPSEAVAAFGCALPTMLEALDRAGSIRPHESLAVQGSGPVGLAATFVARARGAARILVVGAPAHRLEAARSLGADDVIDIEIVSSAEERIDLARKLLGGRGADIVIEATGVLPAFDEGIRLLGKGGRYVVVGLWSATGTVAISPSRINNDNIKVIGSSLAHPHQHHRAIALAQKYHRTLPLAQSVSDRYPLEQVGDALGAARRLDTVKAVITPWAS